MSDDVWGDDCHEEMMWNAADGVHSLEILCQCLEKWKHGKSTTDCG